MIHGGNVWQGDPAHWLDYSANIRPEGAPAWVKAALQGAMDKLSYYPDPQMRQATQALASYLNLPENCVRPTAGGISAIQMANRLPGERTILLTPCFGEYEQFATSPVEKRSLLNGHELLPLSTIGELAKNSLVWMCNPMNPTGAAYEGREIEELLARVEAADSYLIVDEAFIEFCPEHSVAALIPHHERLVVTGSMTKILGIPGVRLGYLLAQPQVLQQLQPHQLTWELSCFAEAVLLELPRHRSEIEADGRINALRREQFRRQIEERGLFVYPSQSACLLVDFSRDVEPIIRYLKERHILVRDCRSFDDVGDGRHLRLAVKDEDSNQRFMETLREAMVCAERV